MKLAPFLVAVAACGGTPTGAPDATPTPIPDAPPTTTVLFLQFEGQAITPGPDAPWDNQSSIVKAPVTVAPFLPSDPDRATKIAAVVDEVKAVLAPYDIDVVTTRPTGVYAMTVIGGAPQDLGLSPYLGAIGAGFCKNPRDHLDFVFETTDGDQHDMSAAIVSMLAFDHGVPYTLDAGDCMCVPTPSGACGHYTAACTIGGAGMHINHDVACTADDTFDEAGLMGAIFGPHR